MKTQVLGSARDSRAGFGDLAETNLLWFLGLLQQEIRDGESPSPARESRALPSAPIRILGKQKIP
jgi:hypothetical protein